MIWRLCISSPHQLFLCCITFQWNSLTKENKTPKPIFKSSQRAIIIYKQNFSNFYSHDCWITHLITVDPNFILLLPKCYIWIYACTMRNPQFCFISTYNGKGFFFPMNGTSSDVNILLGRNVCSNEDFAGITLTKRIYISGLVDRFVMKRVPANSNRDLQ